MCLKLSKYQAIACRVGVPESRHHHRKGHVPTHIPLDLTVGASEQRDLMFFILQVTLQSLDVTVHRAAWSKVAPVKNKLTSCLTIQTTVQS